MRETCNIFFYDGYVSLAPTIFNMSKVLAKSGYSVNIFATQTSSNIPQPKQIVNGVNVVYFTKNEFYHFLSHLFSQPTLTKLISSVKILDIITFSYQGFTYSISNNPKTKKPRNNTDINIGVDEHGLVAALLFSYIFKQKFIFLSLELEQPRKNFGYIANFLRKIITLAYKSADGVIIQDEDRFKTLCDYYQYQHPKVLYLPNSTLQDSCPDANIGNFFREKFNLSEEQFPYIILSAGMIDDNVCSKALAHAFASIDNGCALIFHGAYSQGIEDAYTQSLRQVNSKNLFLSLKPVPYEQVDKIYASSTIGLAFYADFHDNFAKIAKASGKLAFYLKHGKPVLVSNLPSLSRLVEKYQFGIVINNPSDSEEIKRAIHKILNSYSTFSNNAKYCFAAEFDFEKHMEPVLSYIEYLQAKQLLDISNRKQSKKVE